MDVKLERSLLIQAVQAGGADSDSGLVPAVEGYDEEEVFEAAARLHRKDCIEASVGRSGYDSAPESVRLVEIAALGHWRLDVLQRPGDGPEGDPY